MKSLYDFYTQLDQGLKKNSLIIFITYLFVLFSYPFVRSSVGAIFYEHYTSSSFSFATFLSVVILFISIFLCNLVQKKYGVHRLLVFICSSTILGLAISFYFLNQGIKEFAFVLFAAKEIYIVLLVHLVLAYANSYYTLEQVKKLYGPLGAAGSIGGILGGILTSSFAKSFGTTPVFYISLLSIMIIAFCFWFTDKKVTIEEQNQIQKKSPLQSIGNIKKYVFLIALIIAISQWIIFLADLQFNIQFEQIIDSKDARTSYLASMFSVVNTITLVLQIIVIPYLLSAVSTKKVFYFLPLLYLILVISSSVLGMSSLLITAGVFVLMKASDYSLFTVAKEVMYHPLSAKQKYGTKYITDMFSYRLSKAIIALLAAALSFNSLGLINTLQIIFIIIWFILISLLFKERSLMIKKEKNESLIRKV